MWACVRTQGRSCGHEICERERRMGARQKKTRSGMPASGSLRRSYQKSSPGLTSASETAIEKLELTWLPL